METKIKYIYFERYRITGNGQTEFEIRNFNILLNKPEDTGSSGVNNCMNITERNGYMEKSYFVVDQYWIDLEKYKYEGDENKYDKQLNENIDYVLNELKDKKSLNIDGIDYIEESKQYIPSDDMVIDYVNTILNSKTISLGWDNNIFEYNDIQIRNKNDNVVIVDIIYSEDKNDNMCKTFQFPLDVILLNT